MRSHEDEGVIIEGTDNENDFFGISDFDVLKNFTFYYPLQNAAEVILNYINENASK